MFKLFCFLHNTNPVRASLINIDYYRPEPKAGSGLEELLSDTTTGQEGNARPGRIFILTPGSDPEAAWKHNSNYY